MVLTREWWQRRAGSVHPQVFLREAVIRAVAGAVSRSLQSPFLALIFALLSGLSSFAAGDFSPPRSIAEFSEKPVLVQLQDDALAAFFLRSGAGMQVVVQRLSRDLGKTWGEEERLLELSHEPGGWSTPEALVDRDGELHLFFLNDAHSGVILGGEDQRIHAGSVTGIRLDIWHTRSRDGRTRWEAPKKIWEGYTGALNSVIQMKSGRIVLPFSLMTDRTWAKRGAGLADFTFYGQFDSTIVYSDDGGDTWTWPEVRLKVAVPDIVSAYGAVEPVAVELADGRAWMLIRTQQGRFYESFSPDGGQWSEPRPSAILSSDSPAGIIRLSDGRLMLFWNNCQRYPYAYGGRQVLHAAISGDEGKTWAGYREVERDRLRDEPPPSSGDHGTAYPFPIALNDGRAVFVTGQGDAARIGCKLIEPDWLLHPESTSDFSQGLGDWSVFGTKGVRLVPHPETPGVQVLAVEKTEADWPAAAVWNFRAGTRGTLTMRLLVKEGAGAVRVGISDHFSPPFDLEDGLFNLFEVHPQTLPGFKAGSWQDFELTWDCDAGTCVSGFEGQKTIEARQSRRSLTPCYLRIHAVGEEALNSGLLVEQVRVLVTD